MSECYCEEVIICSVLRRGEGKQGDPVRIITQIYRKNGELVAENDQWQEKHKFTAEQLRLCWDAATDLNSLMKYPTFSSWFNSL